MQRVVIIVFDRLQQLDATGPFEVLRAGGYQVELASPTGEPVRSESGLLLGVDRSLPSVRGPLDTLLVSGGHVGEAMHDPIVLRRAPPAGSAEPTSRLRMQRCPGAGRSGAPRRTPSHDPLGSLRSHGSRLSDHIGRS